MTGPALATPTFAERASEPQPRQRDFLPPCAADSAMNCIESIEYQVNGEWRVAQLQPPATPDARETYEYTTPGLQHEGGRTAVSAGLIVRDDINGPPYAAYQFQLQAAPHGIGTFWNPSINKCVGGDPRYPTGTEPCWRAPWLADAQFRFTFRTSTLIPIFVQASVSDMDTAIDEIPGGLRVSISGRPGGSQWVLDYAVAEKTDAFDAVTYEWAGFFSDARARGGALSACQGLGIVTAYSNGNGGQMPEWDAKTGSLSFGTGGFHYNADGSVYKGQAEVFVPGPLARCMWKVDPRQTSRMEIEVYTANGEEAAGTKAIGYDVAQDLVKLIARDFTYSEKNVVARPTPLAALPGKKVCNDSKTVCVTVDKARGSAKVSLSKVVGASQVFAVAVRGTQEDGGTQVAGFVKKGRAGLTAKLNGETSQGQVWVIRTTGTFIGSFQVG
ncbi:MAG: hypothetical protein ACKOFP_03290 [Actinomycetota bacterium]